MKIFLVQAARYLPEFERSMPLGIMYLASYLRERHGCQVKLFDMQLRVKTIEPVVALAESFRPDLIGISGMALDAKVIEALAKGFKEIFPLIPVLVGGPHATTYPEHVMRSPSVDFLIIGEGELATSAFVEYMDGKRKLESIPNLIYRKDEGLHQNELAPFIEDLDSLPFPAYDLIPLERYYNIPRCGIIYSRKRYAAIITSRGCPYRCAYCHRVLGKKYRPRSSENVVDEMSWLVKKFKMGEFIIMDDMFNLQPERINRIAELIIERNLDIKMSFPIGLRGDIMTEESVKLLKEAGMFRCMYAVETASERLQRLLNKNLDIEKVLKIIETTRKHGVMVHGSFMLGFPTESEDEAKATIDCALKSKLHTAAFYRVIPYYGTELRELAVREGIKIPDEPDSYEFHKSDAVNVSSMSNKVLTRLRRKAYRKFYLSPKRLWSIFRALPNRASILPQLFMIWIRKAFLW